MRGPPRCAERSGNGGAHGAHAARAAAASGCASGCASGGASGDASGGASGGAAAAASGGADQRQAQGILRPLLSPDPHLRQACCQSLNQPSLRHDPLVVSALCDRLAQDRDAYVRQAAASSLGQAARRGDEPATAALLAAAVGDVDPGVRRLACTALGQVVAKGHAGAVGGLCGRVDDRDGGVRRAALKALERAAEKGNPSVLALLFGSSGDPEAFVRQTAVEVLSRLASEGNPEVVSRLLELLHTDKDARVRWSATEGLGRVAVRGDSRVLSALLGRLDDDSDSVRRVAAGALGHVTFAPLQELELQERHIADLEQRASSEVSHLHAAIAELKDQHGREVVQLRHRCEELQEALRQDTEQRTETQRLVDEQARQQAWTARVGEFLPHACRVTQFLDVLPSLAGPCSYGTELVAPVWALRCIRGAAPCTGAGNGAVGGAPRPACLDEACLPKGKDKRELLALFELFEQLATGQVTPMDLTEAKPLDVYVHQGEDGAWGLYCCSRQRLTALLMLQACARGEFLTVRCVLRPKDDCGYWGWQWSNFYDGGDGLNVSSPPRAPRAHAPASLSASTSAASRLEAVADGSPPSPRLGGAPALLAPQWSGARLPAGLPAGLPAAAAPSPAAAAGAAGAAGPRVAAPAGAAGAAGAASLAASARGAASAAGAAGAAGAAPGADAPPRTPSRARYTAGGARGALPGAGSRGGARLYTAGAGAGGAGGGDGGRSQAGTRPRPQSPLRATPAVSPCYGPKAAIAAATLAAAATAAGRGATPSSAQRAA